MTVYGLALWNVYSWALLLVIDIGLRLGFVDGLDDGIPVGLAVESIRHSGYCKSDPPLWDLLT